MNSELLRKIGQHYNPRPEPDALGRRIATPVEIQKAMNGELAQEERVVYQKSKHHKSYRR